MNVFQNIVKNVKEFYSEINAATLTGAIDVVVVEQEDGTFKSSPFHVRFGKVGVLKAREKIVDLEVNGEPVEIQMKLDDTGAAFFVERVPEEEDHLWSADQATSPIPEQLEFGWKEQPQDEYHDDAVLSHRYVSSAVQTEVIENTEAKKGKNMKKKRRKKNQHSRNSSKTGINESVTHDLFMLDDVNDADHEDEIGGPEIEYETSPTHLSSEFANAFDLTSTSARQLKRTNSTHSQGSDNSIGTSLIGSRVPKSSSEAEALVLEALLTTPKSEEFRPKSMAAGFHYFSDSEMNLSSLPLPDISQPDPGMLSDSEFENKKREEDPQNVWRWGELPNSASKSTSKTKPVSQESEDKKSGDLEKTQTKSWFGGWGNKGTAIKEEPAGVYLDDIVNDPEKLAYYLKPIDLVKTEEVEIKDPLAVSDVTILDNPKDEDTESARCSSLPISSQSGSDLQNDSDCGPDLLSPVLSNHLPDLAASMCGGLAEGDITLEKFEEHILTFSDFVEQMRTEKSILTDPNLVIRVHEKYLTWTAAAPLLLSVMLFKQPLPGDVVEEITKDCLNVNINMTAEQIKNNRDKSKKSWFEWFGGASKGDDKEAGIKELERIEMSCQTEPEEHSAHNKEYEIDPDSSSCENEKEEAEKPERYRKTLRLSTSNLSKMNLMPGSNEVEFSVTTAFQGTTSCKCHIYLWHHTDKVVISDIDGTITKSDVLGHILPVIGRDWAQSGVAQLFTKINSNSYKIMYLSARAIGQASITKDYLQSVKQGDVFLPDGPIFLNPDSLIHAFRREVIDRNPEEFKIRCLKDIQSLFEQKNPFFAGYGNRPNDAYAYRAVGIPVSRIFTINPAGELRHELTQNYQTSYTEQDSMVDLVFPTVGKDGFDPDSKLQEFSSFWFWREGFLNIDPQALDECLGKDVKK
eukprot:GFUD01031566.1.p1 GENE.GFUD01031566.1~~GFUD01031566.1.p1  ORF type:complete len:914 (+),score=294.80 GFUD01031566.1:301-3042(+)